MSDTEANGNITGENRGPNATTGSVEDLSEYTDADESISAPTEILAEFLSAIMLKDYETALKCCKLILHYEPNNSTAREFYPLIAEKIELMKLQPDETDDDSSSDFSDSAPSIGSNSESESKATDSDATSASYSSLEDEEADQENNVREKGSTSFKPNDFANGNTAKLTNAAGIMFTSNITAKTESHKGNEELKRKFERKSLKQITRIQNDSAIEEGRNRARSGFSSFTDRSCSNSPKYEVDNANCPLFSSDSESPTDPTVQETKTIDVKTLCR